MAAQTPLHPSDVIGRFEVLKVLGQGAQGIVYLARDPHLQRQVAIKTFSLNDAASQPKELKALLDEARIVSQFQHPNIVMVYDAGEQGGQPYLVFEYVAGTPLSNLLKKEGRLPVKQAVDIALQILDGVAYAHKKQIVHRDLKPANIMINAEGTPRIMDFGIAKHLSSDSPASATGIIGTPLYMAPEYITRGEFDERCDVFSAGMILYEMLTGSTAAKGSNVREVLDRMVNQSFSPPSAKNADVSEQLDGIVLKALAKKPEERFESAEDMRLALIRYMNPQEETAEPRSAAASQSTIDFLLRRMRHKSDFPALSRTISDINKIVSDDQEGASKLSASILKDFALTNKLLKVVNTAMYGQFGGTISTISRAVVILGFETVRSAALSLLLFDHLQNKSQAANLKEETVGTFFNGVIGREIGSRMGLRDAEEAFICAMFHNLGKLLVTFYFFEENQEINRLIEQKGVSETYASQQVLGVSFEELATGIAKSWHFPEQIVASMRQISEEKARKPATLADKLQIISSLSVDLSRVASNTPVEERAKEINNLIAHYGDALPLSEKYLMSVMEKSLQEMALQAAVLNIDLPQSNFIRKVKKWSGQDTAAQAIVPQTLAEADETAVFENAADNTLLRTTPLDALGEGEEASPGKVDAAAVLAAGIQDITNTLVGEFALNDLLRMILETMYRGMGFTRVLVCVRDPRDQMLHGRFGYGQDIDKVMNAFKVPLAYASDVFHLALSKGVDVHISDIDADNIRERIPDWYRKTVPASSFIIFPILVDKAPIGMIYADQDKGTMQIEPKELNLLKTLRNQAVLGIKQKR